MWYDVLTVCVLSYATFRGAMKGIVWQLATIASLFCCFFSAGSLSSSVADFIRVEPPLNRWIAMFLLYLGFSFVSFGVARVLREAIEKMKIEALDRHLGALLGLLKGGVLSLFLTFFLVTLSSTARESIMDSESGYVAAIVIDRLDPLIPGDLHALLEPYIQYGPEIERGHHEYVDERRRERGDDRDLADDRTFRGEQRDPISRDDRGRLDSNRDRDRDRNRDGNRDRDRSLDDPRHGDDLPRDRDVRRDDDRRPFERDGISDSRDRRPLPGGDLGDTASDDSDTGWLSAIPAITDELKELALKVWIKTKREHRGELKRLLSGGVPETIRRTLRDWENGRPTTSDAAADDERGGLERDIVRALNRNNRGDSMSTSDIERSLRGIPDDVSLNVLRDWRADLRSDPPDPDSETNAGMSLNDRILRQLKKAGVSLRDLDAATRDRLRGSQLR